MADEDTQDQSPDYEEKLEQLHGMVTKVLLRELAKDDPSSQIISTAVRFLKDNGMTMDAEWSGDLADLADSLNELPFDQGNEQEVEVG